MAVGGGGRRWLADVGGGQEWSEVVGGGGGRRWFSVFGGGRPWLAVIDDGGQRWSAVVDSACGGWRRLAVVGGGRWWVAVIDVDRRLYKTREPYNATEGKTTVENEAIEEPQKPTTF